MLESRTGFQIAKRDLKHYFYKFILLACAVSILIEVRFAIMGASMEQHISLVVDYAGAIGIILFSGIFWPENNPALRELMNSKRVDLKSIYFARYVLSVLTLILLLLVWGYIYAKRSNLNYALLYFIHSFSNSLMFGSLVFALYVLKNNSIFTYMVSFFLFLFYAEYLDIPLAYANIKNCIFIICGILLTCVSFCIMKYKQKV